MFRSEVGDCVDYYFMYGKDADGVIAQVRDLTGQAPMFPLWTYGYWQSKERYKSQEEVVDVVRKYRELGIPLDGIIQDCNRSANSYRLERTSDGTTWSTIAEMNAGAADPGMTGVEA